MTKLRSSSFTQFLLLILASQSGIASAADWQRFESVDSDQWRAFDAARTKLVKPTVVGTWKRYKATALSEKYSGYEYSITEWEIDCAGRRQRILSSFDYDGNGKVVNTDAWKDSEFRPIPPDSKGDVEATIICSKVIKARK
jgi:hypothetical protein